jgi:acyl phosphate:glycerol-3-phosphate acyltransferase
VFQFLAKQAKMVPIPMLAVYILYPILAYLLGAFPYMLILGRARGFDLSKERDLHHAMFQKVGRKEGMSGFLVDFAKGVIAVVVAYYLDLPLIVIAAAGVTVVLGQMWPVFHRFDGERGNTTGAGSTISLAWAYNALWAPIAGVIIVAIGFTIRTFPRFMAKGQSWNDKMRLGGPVSNSLPISVLIGYALMPVICLILGTAWEVITAMALIFVFIVIRRMTDGIFKDVKEKKSSVKKILFNRFLLDRSYYSPQD